MPIIRKIAQLGQPLLREVARQIVDPHVPAIQALIDDMLVTVADANGVGLAAPQVFAPLALFIIASQPNPRYPQATPSGPTVLINPEIIWLSDETELGWEGCLSVPGLRGLVPRHRQLGVRYLDRQGTLREEEYADFPARILQHEYDHIQGIIFIDRLASTRDLVTEQEYLRQLQRLA